MAEHKTNDGPLTEAELATYGIPPKQPDGPKLVKSQEPVTLWKKSQQSRSPFPCFLNRTWETFDRSGARYRLVSWTNTPDGRRRRQAGSFSDAATR